VLYPLFGQLDCPQQTEPGQPETITYSVWYIVTLLLLSYFTELPLNDQFVASILTMLPFSSNRQHLSCDDCLKVRRTVLKFAVGLSLDIVFCLF